MATRVVNLFHAGDECSAVTGGWTYSASWNGSITYGLQGGYNNGSALDVFSWQNDGTIAYAKTSNANMGLERAASVIIAFNVVYADSMSSATDCDIHINGIKRSSLAGYAVGSHTITIPLNEETVDLFEYRVGGVIRSQIQFTSIGVELSGPYIPTAGHISFYNATEHLRINKLYFFDGSTNYQIGKVYERGSTTDHLIYSAEQVLFDKGMVVPWYSTLGGVYAVAEDRGTSLYACAPLGSVDTQCYEFAGWYTDPINFNEWNTLTLGFDNVYSRWSQCDYVVAMLTNVTAHPNYAELFPYTPESQGDIFLPGTHMKDGATDTYYFGRDKIATLYGIGGYGATFTDATWTLDVSGVTGDWRVGVYAVVRYDNAREAGFTMNFAQLS